MRRLLLIGFLFAGVSLPAAVVRYPAPPGAPRSPDYRVFVDGEEIFTYQAPVASFAAFDFEGEVAIEIRPARDVKWVDVRPRSRGVRPRIEQGVIRFSLDRPANLSIEVNGELARPLFLFANPIERDAPKPGDEGVHYFAGGKIYDVGILEVGSDETVYIAGGAIVRGAIVADRAERVTIRGRGILDGTSTRGRKHPRLRRTRLINFLECRDVSVSGIILYNSDTWQIVPILSEQVRISNVKILSGNNSDDGIDIVRSSDVLVDGVFVRTKDDCVAIKSFLGSGAGGDRGTYRVTVQNSVFWNAEWGNAMEIGFELKTPRVDDIVFRNIDVIHVEDGAVFSIHNGDRATVSNVLVEDVRIEDARQKLFDIAIFRSQYSDDKPKTEEERRRLYLHGAWDGVIRVPEDKRDYHARFRGHIKGVRLRNIRIVDGLFPFSIFCGFDREHRVENVTIDGLWVHGRRIRRLEDLRCFVHQARIILN